MGPLHFCDGTVTAEEYTKILSNHLPTARRVLFNNKPFTLQQDNAKPHTARITSAWLRSKRIKPLAWPASSPDISPIENIWRYLKRRVNQRRPTTKANLQKYLLEEWNKIPVEELRKQVHSVPRRLAAVIRRKGAPTQW